MKKLVALLLAMLMVFSLVACGGPKEIKKAASDYPDAVYTDAPFGSDEWDGSLPIVTDNRKIVIGLRTQATVLDYNNNNAEIMWLEEQTGFDIEIKEFSGTSADFNTTVNLMFTGGEEMPDILLGTTIGNNTINEYGRAGYLVNLAGYLQHQAYYTTESLKTYFPDQAEYDSVMNHITISSRDPQTGKMYIMPQMYANTNDTLLAQTVINTDWLEAVGMEAPTNVDELYDVLVAFRDKDPNGNGRKDEIPMMGRLGALTQDIIGYVVNAYVQWNINYKVGVEDGEVFCPPMTDEYREAMKFLNKLVKEGLLSDMTFTATFSDIATVLNPGKGEAYQVGITAAMTDSNFTVDHDSIFKYEPLRPLEDETGRGGYGMVWAYTMMGATLITRDCEDPGAAFRLLDFMNSGEHFLRNRYGVKGEHWDYLPEDVDGTGKGMFGGDAKIVVYKSIQNTTNNFTLGIGCSINCETYWQEYIDKEDNPWRAEMYGDLGQQIQYYKDAGTPEYLFHDFDRTPEEDELFQKYTADITTLIQTACAEFCTGVRDPYSEEDWQTYLNELKQLNIEKAWIEIAQATVDRQLGK